MKEKTKITLIHIFNLLVSLVTIGLMYLSAAFSSGDGFNVLPEFNEQDTCYRIYPNYYDWDMYFLYGLMWVYILWLVYVYLVCYKSRVQSKKQPVKILGVSIFISIFMMMASWWWFTPSFFRWILPLIGRCVG